MGAGPGALGFRADWVEPVAAAGGTRARRPGQERGARAVQVQESRGPVPEQSRGGAPGREAGGRGVGASSENPESSRLPTGEPCGATNTLRGSRDASFLF